LSLPKEIASLLLAAPVVTIDVVIINDVVLLASTTKGAPPLGFLSYREGICQCTATAAGE
jgi:hypothetical protein